MLELIPTRINREQNEDITRPSSIDETTLVDHNTSGPNDFSGRFPRTLREDALLAQEIERDINKRNKLYNVVVKLNMARTYDRVSLFILRKFDLSKIIAI
ncbi:hypothetical protein H5410_003353 [Solanum commersonii]|uniref:Uncharacterized protein n=1 Tax=Solanum commersonii TaxID=4109 RepID=A0A9J6B4V2_SOLCO|nr:hypothetical protein H5410_003353 [Solanum commersonii]